MMYNLNIGKDGQCDLQARIKSANAAFNYRSVACKCRL